MRKCFDECDFQWLAIKVLKLNAFSVWFQWEQESHGHTWEWRQLWDSKDGGIAIVWNGPSQDLKKPVNPFKLISQVISDHIKYQCLLLNRELRAIQKNYTHIISIVVPIPSFPAHCFRSETFSCQRIYGPFLGDWSRCQIYTGSLVSNYSETHRSCAWVHVRGLRNHWLVDSCPLLLIHDPVHISKKQRGG